MARAHVSLIVARLPTFAWLWLASVVLWTGVLSLAIHRTVHVAAVWVLVQALVLGCAIGLCRSDSSLRRARVVSIGASIMLGLSSLALCAGIGAQSGVLASILVTLYLMSALLFAWGWRAELAVLVPTLVAWGVWLRFAPAFLPTVDTLAAVVSGTVIAVIVAEGYARQFQESILRREREREMTRALAESRDAYRDLAENSRDLIWVTDLEGRFVYVNEAVARALGEPAARLTGKVAWDLRTAHPDNPDVASLVARIAGGETIPPVVGQFHTASGPRWMEILASAVTGSDGRIVGLRGISRDVTDRRWAEERLRESEERFRRVFENASIGMAVVGMNRRLTQANQALCEMLGYEAHELLSRAVDDIGYPDDVAKRDELGRRLIAGESQVVELETRCRHRDGNVVWARINVSLVRDRHDAPLYVVALVQDITERKRVEDALRASESRYRGLIESQQDLILRMDTSTRITFVNDAMCDVLGLPSDQVVGASAIDVCGSYVHPDDIRELATLAGSLAQPPYRRRVDHRVIRDGECRWISWEGCAICDERGAVAEIQAVGRDVTEQRRGEEALRTSLEQLRRSEDKLRLVAQREVTIREDERKRLSFDLHDDVCQELVGISILVESARRRGGAMPTESAAELQRVVGYLNEVVEHLRLLAGELRPMLLHDLGLEGSLRALTAGMSSAGTSVVAFSATAIPRLPEDTELALYRIAQEALGNATRHAEARSIVLTISATAGRLNLEICDDGRGFDLGERRAEALGLISMEQRAVALGGRFVLTSERGKGTLVHVECPFVGR